MDHEDRHRSLVHGGCDPPDGLAAHVSHTPREHGQGALDVVPPWVARRMPARQDYAFWWCR